ncbi:MAG: murein biosynthesis integral membrane protein MurJ [Anaerovoracaceae bacterium]|jgi:putative peptidoglycan lipid II flippase
MKTVAKTAFWMAVFTLLSKALGFVREVFLAGYFGVGEITDAYVMANNIPTIIFGGVFSAVATAFMPTFSKKLEQEGEEAANRFTREVVSISLIISAISMVIGFIFSDQITAICAPKFTGFRAELTSFFIKITFTYIFFTCITALMEAYLQYKRVFIPQILAGYTQTLAVIVMIIVAARYDYHLLAFGLLLGYGFKFIIVAIISGKKGFPFKPAPNIGGSAKEIAALSLPVFLGSSAAQINLFVDRTLASGLIAGSVSALNYANTIVNLITGLTTAIIVTIIYPRLTEANSLSEYERFGDMINKGIMIILLISVPFTLGGMLYSDQVIEIVFQRGAFDPAATALTGPAFFYYALGLIFVSANALLVKGYYAMHNMKTPVSYAIICMGINISLNLILIRYMAHMGLALATSIAALINTLLLYAGFRRRYPEILLIKSAKQLSFILFASAVAVGASWPVYLLTVSHTPLLISIILTVSTAAIIYLILFLTMGKALLQDILN